MPPLSLLIKPASSNCNLRCRYCFYYDIAEARDIKSYGIMENSTLEVLVRRALEYADHTCTFAFQGGEPTLAGVEFYKKLVEYQQKYNIKKVRIDNALQTNGVLIDEDWADFLHRNKFLVGLSLDGPKDINDSFRYDHRNKGIFTRIMRAARLFDKYKVDYNILCVVNGVVAQHGARVYNFFKKQGFRYLQFIQCLDPLEGIPGSNLYSLTPEKYALFLKTVFDLWYQDIVSGRINIIRYFDNLVGMIMGCRPEACGMSGECNCNFVIEADGGVYPCDFYVTDQWLLGNVKDSGLSEIKNTYRADLFIEASKYVDPKCKECKWFNLCRGGCRRNREQFTDGRPSLNYYCSAFREFFDYAYERLYGFSQNLKFNRQISLKNTLNGGSND